MNNYLDGKTAYLCGSIKGLKDSGTKWRETITPLLQKMGINVLDPCNKNTIISEEVGKDKIKFQNMALKEDWGNLKKEFWQVVRYDLRCIDRCDFVIVNYDPTVPTIGTVHELVVATFEKKVILLKYDKDQLESFNPWMATFIKSHHFFPEWDSMLNYLGEVNKGILDTSYWVI